MTDLAERQRLIREFMAKQNAQLRLVQSQTDNDGHRRRGPRTDGVEQFIDSTNERFKSVREQRGRLDDRTGGEKS